MGRQLCISGDMNLRISSHIQIISDNNHSVDNKRRLALGSTGIKALMPIWKQNRISVKLRLKLFWPIVIPVAMYSCEAWTVRVDDSR